MNLRPLSAPGRRWRAVVAAALLVVAGILPGRATEVSSEVQALRLDALRSGLPPSELLVLLPPLGEPEPEPPAEWIYRAPLLGSLARAAGGAEGLFQTGLRQLSRGSPNEAAEAFAKLRESYPGAPRAGAAAFWLAELSLKRSAPEEAIFLLRLVTGPRSDEAAYRLGLLLHRVGRVEEAGAVWAELAGKHDSRYPLRAQTARGVSLLLQGDEPHARMVLEAALAASRAPDGEAGYAILPALALALQRSGELTAGHQAFLQLLLDRPEHPAALLADTALAWLLLELSLIHI